MRSNDLVQRSVNHFRWLTFPVLEEYNFVVSGFMVKNRVPFDGKALKPGIFFKNITRPARPVISLKQVHQDECVIITSRGKLKKRYRGDAILTNRKDILISIQVADCVPIFLVEEKRKVIGLIHAGWKGTLLGIARRTMEEARDRLDCKPANFTVVFGPCIRSCCYRVSDDISVLFDEKCTRRPVRSEVRLDLIRANMQQFLNCGVKEDRIFATANCTGCNAELFHSYRREKENAGRMTGFLGLK